MVWINALAECKWLIVGSTDSERTLGKLQDLKSKLLGLVKICEETTFPKFLKYDIFLFNLFISISYIIIKLLQISNHMQFLFSQGKFNFGVYPKSEAFNPFNQVKYQIISVRWRHRKKKK